MSKRMAEGLSLNEDYIGGIAVAHFILAGERLGVPARDLLRQRGVDPDVAMQPASRLSGDIFDAFFMDMLLASGDEYFGFHLGHQLMPGLYGALSNLLFSSMNMREGVQLGLRFQELGGGTIHGFVLEELDDGGLLATWTMVSGNAVLRRHLADNMFALLANFVSVVFPSDFPASERMTFAYPAPPREMRQQMEALYRCPIEFDAPASSALLSAELLARPINIHDTRQRQLAVELAEQQLAEQKLQRDWLSSVRRQMRGLLPGRAPQREEVARRLGMSARTLDRRLAENDSSWQQQLDSLRAQLAREYLGDASLSVADVAGLLGFADVRALQRRFRIWTGMTPSQYRQQLGTVAQ
ncbi:MAG: AraC family transcriptional regulator ligand-binding domain-containing protein [Gammaproteobacteria bacterium]|nr:AraC family transcriptional regulator ligand-binding domain-containing protein [Gammaproteobacteria bacterium]MBQ0775586.1 AraC family transcriptional regulator ligand-binding domain-containing protein [Gammaproteobacteria bacterium]